MENGLGICLLLGVPQLGTRILEIQLKKVKVIVIKDQSEGN
jgi:hypothetical protein